LALFALACGEWAARAWLAEDFRDGEIVAPHWSVCAQIDPALGWSNLPNSRARVVAGPMDYRVEINSLGWRDRERALARKPGVTRILALGDSMTWGWGVDAEARFSDLLEERMQPSVEVWNTSSPGWGTDQEYWALQDRLLAVAPDIVVLGVVFNDIQDVGSKLRYDMNKPQLFQDASGAWQVRSQPVSDPRGALSRALGSVWQKLLAHSALLQLTHSGGNPARFSMQRQGYDWREQPVEQRRLRPGELLRYEQRCAALVDPDSAMYSLLSSLRASCAAQGCDLILISLPHQHDPYLLDPRHPRPVVDGDTPFQSAMARRLHEAGEQLGIAVLDFEPQFLERSAAGEFLHCGDSHLNAQGHRVVADALEPRLRELIARRALGQRPPR
jgi:hypothetical protein